jgi:predicted ATPase with chaperone activity
MLPATKPTPNSGPLLDRIDMQVAVPAVLYRDLKAEAVNYRGLDRKA